MEIKGRVVNKGILIKDATVRLSLVKRSDGVEIEAVDLDTVDNGSFKFSHDVVEGLPCNSQHFSQVKYSVVKPLYQPAQGNRQIVDDEEKVNLGDIELAWKALRIHGQITSNARPVKGATVIVQIDNVERARILTDHEGKFTRDIEGDYEGRTLMWTVKRFGYISEMGSIQEIRSIEVEVREDDLVLYWWAGICQSLGVDPRVVLGVLGVLLSLGLGWALWNKIICIPSCPEPSVKAADFRKDGVNSRDIETAFSECLFISHGKCGQDKDASIRQCMENRGYKYSK